MAIREFERLHSRLLVLWETTRVLASKRADYTGVLDAIVQQTVQCMCDGSVIGLVSRDEAWLEPAAVYHRDADVRHIARDLLMTQPARLDGPGQAAKVVRTGKAVLLPRIAPSDVGAVFAPQYVDLATRLDIRSLLYVPVVCDGRVIGVLMLLRSGATSPPFDGEDEEFAGHLADLAALAIANASLLQTAQREIEERRRAEEAAAKFVALVQHSTELIAMASLDWRVLFVNEAGRALVGLEPDRDVTELTLRDFHTDGGLKRATLLQAHGKWRGDGQLRHFRTGELIDVFVSSFLVRDARGEPIGYATLQRDIRDLKRLESQLRQSQKMEAIGRLAGGIAHDFNNLLSVILSYSSLLVDDLPSDASARADIEEIHRAGERAAALTQQLLAFSRQQILEPRVVDLSAILVDFTPMTRRLLGEDVALQTDPGSGLYPIRVDVSQMEQILMNLVVNARDAMPSGGVLTIATENVDLDDDHADDQVGVRPGAYVALTVSDTGAGMDEATLARIFDPFFTTKDRGKGTGLGLATVFGIVQQSGGHVSVESKPGKGTTFRIILPRHEDAAEPPPMPTHAAAATKPGGTETILLVDDEEQVRTLLSYVLSRVGYRVLETSQPDEALRESERFEGEIHLLLTDVIMPRMNGRQLAERMRVGHPEARVLYISGYSDEVIAHHGVLDRSVMLLRKPVTPESLLQRVRQALDS